MKSLAILHHHLRPGGVTTVIRNAQQALAGTWNVRVLADFGYNDKPARSRAAFLTESGALMRRIAASLRTGEVLHTHNLTLGKHPGLTCAVKLLAEAGRIKVINQVHDFVEDERPAQLRALRYCTGRRDDRFWRELCYFDCPNVIWAMLTTHAAAQLAGCGVPPGKIHVLPNPVDVERFSRPPPLRAQLDEALARIATFARRHRYNFDPGRKILLSPIKIMERKNNAEAVELVARLNRMQGREEFQLLISLDAESSGDRRYSAELKREVRRRNLPVVIGIASVVDAFSQFHLAHAILTTSRMEGFGYAFVEGWLCGKLVLGRGIPEVTRDFVAEGMDLRHLYREFSADAVRRVARLLARPPPKLIAHNRSVVMDTYSLHAYARRFAALLHKFRRNAS